MCKKRRQHHQPSSEGIRFLDETPEPPSSESSKPEPAPGPGSAPEPAPTTPPPPADRKRNERRGVPIGTLAFLAVVVGGFIWKINHQEAPPGINGVPVAFPHRTVEEVLHRSIDVGPNPRIEVETFNGEVRVDRGVKTLVDCRVTTFAQGDDEKTARETLRLIQPRIEHEANVVRIRIDRLEDGPATNLGASVHLRVPAEAEVRLVTRNGSVQVRDVRGSIAARSSNGKIEVEGARGLVSLETTNGPIECQARDALIHAETSNGPISFQGSLRPGSSRFETTNGSVTLRFPEDEDFHLDARTSLGSVVSEFPSDDRGIADSPTVLVADFGSNDPEPDVLVEVRASNGSIRVEQADD